MWIAKKEAYVKENEKAVSYRWEIHEVPPGQVPADYYATFIQNYGQENVMLLERLHLKIKVDVEEPLP